MVRQVYPLLAIGLMLSACGKGEAAPSGQVVATVDGEEITRAELQLEMAGDAGSQSGEDGTKAALQSLIARKLLAAEATRRELDKTPTAAMLQARAQEAAKVELLQQSLSEDAPTVPLSAVQKFVNDNPAMFENRRLLSVDKIVVAQVPAGLAKRLEPLKSLAEVEALLTSNSVNFVRTANVLDTVTLSPQAAQRISGLGQNEVLIFISPSGGLEVSQITGVRSEPLISADAERVARGILTRSAGAANVQAAMSKIVQDGQAKVKFNPEFAPKRRPPAK